MLQVTIQKETHDSIEDACTVCVSHHVCGMLVQHVVTLNKIQ
jgi:hypothetical protein